MLVFRSSAAAVFLLASVLCLNCLQVLTKSTGCDADCLETKLNEILDKLKGLESKVDTLRDSSNESKAPIGCRRYGRGRFLQQSFLHRESSAKLSEIPSTDGESMKCSAKLSNICRRAGVAEISLDSIKTPIKVFCGWDRWILVMRRVDGSVGFHNKTWNEYKKGFGVIDTESEFFLGLQHLHELTSTGFFELRIVLEDFENNKRKAFYSDFSVFDESTNYRLGSLGVYSGDAGDSFTYHEGQGFTTLDRDNDDKVIGSCGEEYNSAGWFKSCMEANLMGAYLRGETDKHKEGMYWETFRGPEYSLKSVKLAIRAKC